MRPSGSAGEKIPGGVGIFFSQRKNRPRRLEIGRAIATKLEVQGHGPAFSIGNRPQTASFGASVNALPRHHSSTGQDKQNAKVHHKDTKTPRNTSSFVAWCLCGENPVRTHSITRRGPRPPSPRPSPARLNSPKSSRLGEGGRAGRDESQSGPGLRRGVGVPLARESATAVTT